MNPSKTIEVLKYIDCISNTNIGNYGPYRVMWRWGKLGRQKWLEQCSMNIVSLTVVPLFLSYVSILALSLWISLSCCSQHP